jgi:hypothetical protein
MQQGMDQASVPITAILDQIVGRVMVVVVEEGGGREKFRRGNGQPELPIELEKPDFQGDFREHSAPGARPQIRELGSGQALPETGGAGKFIGRTGHRADDEFQGPVSGRQIGKRSNRGDALGQLP